MGKRPSANSFGLTAPSILPVANAPGPSHEVDRELAELLRRRRDLMTIQTIAAMDAPAPGPATPGPATLTEAVTAAATIASLHQGAAQTAMQERDAAERRAAQAREDAAKREEAARSEERSQGALLLQLMERFTTANQETIRAAHETQVTLLKQAHEHEISALTAKFEGLFKQVETAIGQKEGEIERLRRQNEALSGQPTPESMLMRLLISGPGEDPTLTAFSRLLAPAPAADDPNHVYQTGMAQVMVEKAKRELTAEEQKLQHAAERHQQVGQLINGLTNLLGNAHQWLPQVLGSFTGGGQGGGVHNGVPSGFEDIPGGNVVDVQ